MFLEAILSSLKGGVAVLDRELRVRIWNSKSADLWGLGADEALDRNFLSLDIGLPVEDLGRSLRDSLGGNSQDSVVVLDATNRRGRAIRCRVTITPLNGPNGDTHGVILHMEEAA